MNSHRGVPNHALQGTAHRSEAAPAKRRWPEADVIARRLLALGLFWLPVGMACTPGHDPRGLYNWSLGLLLYLPSLWLLIRQRQPLTTQWWSQSPLRLCLGLLLWSGITLFWAEGAHPAERLKAPIFVLFYLSAWLAWTGPSLQRATRMLYVTGLAMALCALAAMIAFPWRDLVWVHRMIGLGLLDGPNLSAYAMGISFIWLSQLMPPRGWQRTAWLTALAVLLVFVAWTGSRGSWLALFLCLVSMPIWRTDRLSRWFAGTALATAVAVLLMAPIEILHRGMSYRPGIFGQAMELISRHPLLGLGLGSNYEVSVGDQSWTHSHSLFTNVAIETGVPGLLLWLALWLWTGLQGWRYRQQTLGRALLVMWIFATVALQFDGPMLLHSPRAEWLLTWLPAAIALQLFVYRNEFSRGAAVPSASGESDPASPVPPPAAGQTAPR